MLSRVSGYRAQPPRPNRVLRVTDTRPRSEVIASGHTASNAPDLFRLRRPRAMSRSPRLVRVALDFIKSSARRVRQVSFAPVCIRHGRNLAWRGCLRWGRGARGSPQAGAPGQDVIVCAHPTALAPRTRSRPQPAPAQKNDAGTPKWTNSLRASEKRARGDHRSASKPTPTLLVATPSEVCGETRRILVAIKAQPRLLVATSN